MSRRTGTVTPSKYFSLERLKEIRENHYTSVDAKNPRDFDKEAVDKLIWDKQSRKADEAIDKQVSEWDEYEEFLRAEQNKDSYGKSEGENFEFNTSKDKAEWELFEPEEECPEINPKQKEPKTLPTNPFRAVQTLENAKLSYEKSLKGLGGLSGSSYTKRRQIELMISDLEELITLHRADLPTKKEMLSDLSNTLDLKEYYVLSRMKDMEYQVQNEWLEIIRN